MYLETTVLDDSSHNTERMPRLIMFGTDSRHNRTERSEVELITLMNEEGAFILPEYNCFATVEQQP